MDRCDCLLAIGCRFSEVATGSYGIDPPECLVHVDVDPTVFDRNFRARLAIPADAAAFVRALGRAIEGARPWHELAAEIADGHRALDRRDRSSGSGDQACRVSPAALLGALQRHCGPDAVFTTDSGNGTFLAMEHLRLDRPGCFLGPIDFSCMGYAVPAAIGAAFVQSGRDVVALAGDGALLMTGLELLTAATHRVAPLVCVLRDGMLGQISMFQKLPLNRTTCTVLPDYRVQDLAATVGCRYFRLIHERELDTLLPAMLELTRAGVPVMVEVAIDYSRQTHFTRGVVATNLGRLPWGERLRMIIRALGRRLVPGP
jgi:acetolactate synthase-1/2/3 large subunit